MERIPAFRGVLRQQLKDSGLRANSVDTAITKLIMNKTLSVAENGFITKVSTDVS